MKKKKEEKIVCPACSGYGMESFPCGYYILLR